MEFKILLNPWPQFFWTCYCKSVIHIKLECESKRGSVLLNYLQFKICILSGSCKAYMEVETNEGGNANLPFTTVGLTIFSEIDCVKGTEITRIGQYCGPDENCSTSLSTPFSIETGNLTIRNVTSNRCFRAQFIQGTRNNQTLYNVTINSEYVTMSTFLMVLQITFDTSHVLGISWTVEKLSL